MRCKKARILVSASLDGELSRREQSALQRHLSACAGCAEESARFSALRDTISLWTDEEPSERLAESFAHKLHQLQQKEPAAKPVVARWLLGTAAAGAATALVMVGFLLHSLLVQPVPLPAPAEVVKPPAAAGKPTGAEKSPAPGTISGITAAPAVRKGDREPTRVGRPQPARGRRPRPLASRVRSADEARRMAATEIAAAGIAQGAVAAHVMDSLSGAELAMNETVERVRGTLQETVDLVVSKFPAPADNTLSPNGGSTP